MAIASDQTQKPGAQWHGIDKKQGSKLRCLLGDAISSGCFILFGLLWFVTLSAPKAN